MKKLLYLFVAILLFTVTACNTGAKKDAGTETEEPAADEVVADNTLTEQEKADGWILLFDGETTNGWRKFNSETFPDTGWYIADGCLVCENSGMGEAGFGGDIIYDKQFTNFDFKVDWMISEGGNSGIFILGQEIPGEAIWYTAPEYQILDNNSSHPDNWEGVNGNRRSGSLYDLLPSDTSLYRGPMEWNTAEIVVYEGSVFFKTNGKTTVEFHLWTPVWNDMITNSKFPDFNPDFANVAHTGFIGLQDHGNAVWFKNIKIKEL